jgi:hypothetical protein
MTTAQKSASFRTGDKVRFTDEMLGLMKCHNFKGEVMSTIPLSDGTENIAVKFKKSFGHTEMLVVFTDEIQRCF